MSDIDWLILGIYLVVVYWIAWRCRRFIRGRFYSHGEPAYPMAVHYLAGRTLKKSEICLSIVATEVSAITFLVVPTYAFMEDFSYIRFVIGTAVGRLVGSKYILPLIYNKGLTTFEILARGIHGYSDLGKSGNQGKKVAAGIYVFLKIFGVAARLAGGAVLLSQFLDVDIVPTIFIICLLTYFYLMIGGLKAVVRTDMLQGTIFVLGGILAIYVIGKASEFTSFQLAATAFTSGKFNLFGHGSLWNFALGIAAGFIMDISSHAVDQEMVQKLLGARSLGEARQAMVYSAFWSLFINLIFLLVGASLWAFYQTHSLPVGFGSKEIFSHFLMNYFPSPFKGLIVAALLAATMSSLDSSINAMSACLWNDIFPTDVNKLKQESFIKIDNLIMTMAVAVYACLIGQSVDLMYMATHLATWAAAPILGIFLVRLAFPNWIKFAYTWHVILFTYTFSLVCMSLARGAFAASEQLTILMGVVASVIFLWPYSWIMKKEKDLYEVTP
ncbi:MAG: sodium:solute symporter family transporter [Bacteriovoracaceae bacterium]